MSSWGMTWLSVAGLLVAVVALFISFVSARSAERSAEFAKLQHQRMKEAWQTQNAFELARDLQSERQRAARRTIYELHGGHTKYASWTKEQKHLADYICQQLQTAAILDKQELLPPGFLALNWGDLTGRYGGPQFVALMRGASESKTRSFGLRSPASRTSC